MAERDPARSGRGRVESRHRVGFVRELLTRSPGTAVGAALLGLHVVLALLGPTLARYPYAEFHMMHALEPPSREFWGGTDQFGRDQWSRVMWGARGTLTLAAVSTVLGVGLGVVVGMLGGYYRGLLDEILGRGVDALMALPALPLAMLLLTTVGANPIYVALGIAVVFMPRSARVLRGVALRLAASEFIDAARVRGERGPYIILHEMLPNAWAPITVELTIRFAYAILLATSLGLPGAGRPAARTRLGAHDQRGASLPQPGALAGHPPGGRHLLGRRGRQPARRRPPRGARSPALAEP